MAELNFGLLEAPESVKQVIAQQQSIKTLLREPTEPVNVRFKLPDNYRAWYDQKKTPECVGFAWSIYQTGVNYFERANTWPRYDARGCYAMATLIDGDPRTNPNAYLGTFLFAGAKVLRNYGALDWVYHKKPWNKRRKLFDQSQGIVDYWWVDKQIDEIRLCFAAGRPVMFGIVVYEGMLKPKQKEDGNFWFNPNDGKALGLHALSAVAFSDEMEAIGFANSWGKHWPEIAWASFGQVEKWLHGGLDARFAEIMTSLDIPNQAAAALHKIPEQEYVERF